MIGPGRIDEATLGIHADGQQVVDMLHSGPAVRKNDIFAAILPCPRNIVLLDALPVTQEICGAACA